MCGIIGIFNQENAFENIKKALAILKNRGKDGFGIASKENIQYEKDLEKFNTENFNNKNLIGHSLHAIVGEVSQPLSSENKKSFITSNCEIYNWKELDDKYKLNAKNDADLILKFLNQFSIENLDELDGVYAFAYWKDNKLILARDLLGIKPLWYHHSTDNFSFASEKKALEKLGHIDIQELNPRQIIEYNLETNQVKIIGREFFTYKPEHKESHEIIKKNTSKLLDQAISKRIPEKKFGLLFSGGIDSTFLAKYFKDNNHDFTCYTAALETENTQPKDLVAAKKVAKELGLNLKIKTIKIENIPKYLEKIVPLIEDSNVVKVGVALTFYLACEMAKEDDCKVIFSGLGSEEIFAGYERHKNSSNINQECVSGLIKMYERDLYRDDVLTMDNNLELRLPFLDKELIDYSLKIPSRHKIKDNLSKYILREISINRGINEEFSLRKKTAAQYGSRFDFALGKLAKQNKFKSKSEYLNQFYPTHNLKLGVLFSSGKDSTHAAYIMQRQNYELSCLITIKSKNPHSYMFHTPAIDLAKYQAEAMELPILIQETKGEKEIELEDLEEALKKAKDQYKIEGIITGALFSTYQRDRIEKICDKLGLKIFSPLWHKPQERLMQELLDNNYKIIFTAIAAYGLNKSWLNKVVTEKELDKLKNLNKKIGLNVAGEGGETESFVLDAPLFKKKLVVEDFEIVEDNENTAKLIIKKLGFKEKF